MIEILKSWFKLLVARQFTTTNVDCFGLAQTLWYRVLLTLVWSSDHKCQSSLWKYEMTQNPRRSSRIARCAVNHGARPAMTFQVAVEKSTAKTKAIQTKKINSRLMKGKKDIFIAAFNVQTLHAYHTQTNRNGSKLKDYINDNNLLCLNTKYQKRTGQLWIHISPNGSKAQLDYVINNRKWKNSAKNCRTFNSFVSVASDHRVVSTQIRLSLRANKKKNSNISPYDWTHLKDNSEIRNTFITRVKNRFVALQDTTLTKSTNTRYNLFELACKETWCMKKPKRVPHKPINLKTNTHQKTYLGRHKI